MLFLEIMEGKMKFAVLAAVLLLGACAVNKTPLTPQGQLNACLRDELNSRLAKGGGETLGNAALAQKVAQFCLKKLDMEDAFSRETALRNAHALLTRSEGTSLR